MEKNTHLDVQNLNNQREIPENALQRKQFLKFLNYFHKQFF